MKTILSIDGGGIRGIIPALVVAHLEKASGKPACQLFDLMAGTSTGGIIAMGLAAPDPSQPDQPRYRAKDLADLYERHGREIFSRSLWKGITSTGGLTDETYSHRPLEDVLHAYFGDHTLGECLCPVMATAYDIEARDTLFFKSWKPRHHAIPLKQVCRATSAAPTYFEPAEVEIEGVSHALIDGGVYINSPAVSAYAEATRLWPDEPIRLLSLGTGELTRPIWRDEARDWGKAGWLKPLLDSMFDGAADAVDYQMAHFLGDRYTRLQLTLDKANDDMDDATAGNIENLKRAGRALVRKYKDGLASFAGG